MIKAMKDFQIPMRVEVDKDLVSVPADEIERRLTAA